jgi:antitoxin component YwqK of YwqJK toxin-antitoxin module
MERIEHFSNGTISSITTETSRQLFYKTGKLYVKEAFEGGKFHGVQEYFYENGSRKTILPFQHGKLHGTASFYNLQGLLIREIHLAHGERDGLDTMWASSGEILFCLEYSKGKLIKTHIPDPYIQAFKLDVPQ